MADTLVAPEALVDDNGERILTPTLNHCGLATSRPQEMMDWYRNVLGQQVTLSADKPAVPFPMWWSTNDHIHHRMGFFQVPNVAKQYDPLGAGPQHIAWEYPSIDDVLSTWDRLRKLGITPMFMTCHGISFAAYYTDPDGNWVELLADAHSSHEESLEYQLNSEELRANPPGVPVDPPKLIEARAQGVELEDLRQRALAGEYRPAPDAAKQGGSDHTGHEAWKDGDEG